MPPKEDSVNVQHRFVILCVWSLSATELRCDMLEHSPISKVQSEVCIVYTIGAEQLLIMCFRTPMVSGKYLHST